MRDVANKESTTSRGNFCEKVTNELVKNIKKASNFIRMRLVKRENYFLKKKGLHLAGTWYPIRLRLPSK